MCTVSWTRATAPRQPAPRSGSRSATSLTRSRCAANSYGRRRAGRLAEPPGDVVLGQSVPRIREEPVGLADLDELAQMEVCRALRHARGLLHRVRDDDDRVGGSQLIDEILDAGRRCG